MGMIRIKRRTLAGFGLATLCLVGAGGNGLADETEANRAARWHDVAAAVFDNRKIDENSDIVQLDAPPRALDAALVPVTITIKPDSHVVGLTLVIDDNPAPVAAKFHFGPLADPHVLKTRVRVDQYTLLHAVAELQDGTLVSTERFIKAAGGCSAPGGTDVADAMARLGKMRLRLDAAPQAGAAMTANLLISHPNFNGMQMNPVTRLYTPARYVQTVRVSQAGQDVFTLQGDISLSEDPAIGFEFKPVGTAPVDVDVTDSTKAVFHQSFPLDARGS